MNFFSRLMNKISGKYNEGTFDNAIQKSSQEFDKNAKQFSYGKNTFNDGNFGFDKDIKTGKVPSKKSFISSLFHKEKESELPSAKVKIVDPIKDMPSKEVQGGNTEDWNDARNSGITVMADGSMIDSNPQSWENTTRQPNRNGSPTHSDLVDEISYDATHGTTNAKLKRGDFVSIPDNGEAFKEFENAGSKGRHAVASGNVNF